MKMSTSVPLYIIAIGASAGGMDDIHLFFDHTPLEGVSYIIVQHLSPDFKSRMVELLARHSKIKVMEAEENMLVESNQVYTIPNKKYITIREGRLHLTEKEKNNKPKLTIDVFFNSLAAERGRDAIAVILSGVGSDGSDGIKAIKKAGGMVIACNPEKAAFSTMPANAIATGVVDYVLDTETIPQTITDYVNNKEVLLPGITEKDNEEKYVAAIINLLTDKLSFNFSEFKEKTIIKRIKKRAAYHNLSDLEDYVALLKANPDEIKTLVNDFLLSVTSFFSDKEAFQFLLDNSTSEQAYNETLLSANKEMQSLIKELHTINADYHLKNKELLEINDDLNNYFSSNQNGQLFVNGDLLLTKFSPAAVKHINLVETDIGRPISNISTNIKFETIVSDIKKVIVNGGVITKEVEALNGKWYQMMTMPFIRFIDNKIDGAIITFNDITELKKIQKELFITNKNLTRINADLDNFVLAASHDLLGPLSNIEVSIDMLKADNLISDPLVNEYLNIIDGSVQKFRILIKELSTIGKPENETPDTKPVDLNNIIDEIKLSISDKIRATAAEITTELEVEQILFSKKNLRSLLYNVITNAIKYKSADRVPVLIIRTRIEKGYVLLSIKDNGIGIAKDKIDKIFHLYSRIQTDIEGEGIGLYLVKKIVDASGGYISVESEVGKGSTFNICFKLEQ
jgi:signal transduction histidine kinase